MLNIDETRKSLIELSQAKWEWMAEKKVDSLKGLVDEASVFVHMGGTWGKERA